LELVGILNEAHGLSSIPDSAPISRKIVDLDVLRRMVGFELLRSSASSLTSLSEAFIRGKA
jgi:hypothetical protein